MTDLNRPHRIFRFAGGALDLESVNYITYYCPGTDGNRNASASVCTSSPDCLKLYHDEAKAVMDAWVAYRSPAPRERL